MHWIIYLVSNAGARGGISFPPARRTLIHCGAVRGVGIIKVITVGYSGLLSQRINSLAHTVSAAPQCVGDPVPITCTLSRFARDINGAAFLTAPDRLPRSSGASSFFFFLFFFFFFITIATSREEAEGGKKCKIKVLAVSSARIPSLGFGGKPEEEEEVGCDTNESADVPSFFWEPTSHRLRLTLSQNGFHCAFAKYLWVIKTGTVISNLLFQLSFFSASQTMLLLFYSCCCFFSHIHPCSVFLAVFFFFS